MKIFSNLAVTIDGKIAERSKPAKALGSPLDRRTMDLLRAEADVIVSGSNTLRAYPKCYKVNPKNLPAAKRKNLRQPANAVLTASGDLDPEMPFWNDPEVVRFVFTTEEGLAKATRAARERAFVVSAGRGRVDLDQVVERFRRSGLERVLVEGGGELIAEFLRVNLLQEMNVTLTPWAMGGRDNPTLVGGVTTLDPWSRLKLVRAKKVKDEIYLRYKVEGARRV